MRITVLRDNLQRALSVVSKGIDSHSTLPVLGNVLLRASNAEVVLTGTNLEQTTSVTIGARVDLEGAITLPAKRFTDVVNSLKGDTVDVEIDYTAMTATLRSGKSKSVVKGLSADEFPPIPNTNEGDAIEFDGAVFKELIRHVVYAVAKEGNRPILTGVSITFDKGFITFAAADGFRLAVVTHEIEHPYPVGTSVVVPARALNTIFGVIDSKKACYLLKKQDDELLHFNMDGVTLSTQLLSGKFPDYAAIIPKSYTGRYSVTGNELNDAVKAANVFGQDNNYSVRLNFLENEFQIIGKSNEMGEYESLVDVTTDKNGGLGEGISLNGQYLQTVLQAYAGDDVEIEYNGSNNPLVVRHENGRALSVIMPMR